MLSTRKICSPSARRRDGFDTDLNRVIAKEVKVLPTAVRCATLIVCVGGMPLPLNRRSSLPYTVGTFKQGYAIKVLVVCYVVWLGSMKGVGL